MGSVNQSTKATNFSNVNVGASGGSAGGDLTVNGDATIVGTTAMTGDLTLTGEVLSANSLGTAGTGVTVVENGSGKDHVTEMTLAAVAITIGDNAALADGALIYTFPAGIIQINGVTCTVGLNLTTGTPTTDTPEIGLGTVIGSGANATLGAVAAGAEDIAGPAVMDDIAGTAEIFSNATPQIIALAGVHLVHCNVADTWADVDNTAATLDGTVTISWTLLS